MFDIHGWITCTSDAACWVQRKLHFLLDSGASHSFIAANVIRELGLKTHFVDALEVLLADNSVVCLCEVVDLHVCFA